MDSHADAVSLAERKAQMSRLVRAAIIEGIGNAPPKIRVVLEDIARTNENEVIVLNENLAEERRISDIEAKEFVDILTSSKFTGNCGCRSAENFLKEYMLRTSDWGFTNLQRILFFVYLLDDHAELWFRSCDFTLTSRNTADCTVATCIRMQTQFLQRFSGETARNVATAQLSHRRLKNDEEIADFLRDLCVAIQYGCSDYSELDRVELLIERLPASVQDAIAMRTYACVSDLMIDAARFETIRRRSEARGDFDEEFSYAEETGSESEYYEEDDEFLDRI